MRRIILLCILELFLSIISSAQDDDKFIHSKEGNVIGFKKQFITQCKTAYAAPSGNQLVTQVCNCQANLFDRRFEIKLIKTYQRKYKASGFTRLIEDDTVFQRQLKECASDTKKLNPFEIPAYRKSFVDKCIQGLVIGEKSINDTLANLFCSCAADVLEERKISLDRLEELADQSSFLYNEVAYKCGSPYLKPSDFTKDWLPSDSVDILGPPDIDSVPVISLMGMHKIKITIGKETRIWLIDSGASDLLVSDQFLKILQQNGVIKNINFIGVGKYQIANGALITCKKYKIDGVGIGSFKVNNVIIASSPQVVEFLLGKSLLNKFQQWMIDNSHNLLILKK